MSSLKDIDNQRNLRRPSDTTNDYFMNSIKRINIVYTKQEIIHKDKISQQKSVIINMLDDEVFIFGQVDINYLPNTSKKPLKYFIPKQYLNNIYSFDYHKLKLVQQEPLFTLEYFKDFNDKLNEMILLMEQNINGLSSYGNI